MKITRTREVEKALVAVYEASKQKKDCEEKRRAKRLIELIDQCFKLLDAYTGEKNQKRVKKLYFSSRNILRIGVWRMTEEIFLTERTLFKYRQKYCKIIALILEEYEKK